MSTSRPHPPIGRAALAVGLLVGGALLSGCGVSDERPRPGAAAQVGDVRITTDEVDDTLDTVCDFLSSRQQGGYPMSVVRQQLVGGLVQASAVTQVMEETGAELGDDYQAQLQGLEDQYADLPDDIREAYLSVTRAGAVVAYGTAAIGVALGAPAPSGATDPSDPTATDEATTRGQDAVDAWFDDHDVSIDPIYQLALVDGTLTGDFAGTSVPQSDFAQAAVIDLLSTDPDVQSGADTKAAALTKLLPADQLCGG